MGLGSLSGITVSWIIFDQLLKLFVSSFSSSYDVISWIHVHAHSRDLVGDPVCRYEVNGADVFWFVAACKRQNGDREEICLSCARQS